MTAITTINTATPREDAENGNERDDGDESPTGSKVAQRQDGLEWQHKEWSVFCHPPRKLNTERAALANFFFHFK